MTEQNPSYTPTEINLHKKSRLLIIKFLDETSFIFPCEYLRVSPAEENAEVKPAHGKGMVSIESLKTMETESLEIKFDDGFTENYTWEYLHALATNYQQYWDAYLDSLAKNGLTRGQIRKEDKDGKVAIKILYFIHLAKISGKDEEDVVIPDTVMNVETLLSWIRQRGSEWEEPFMDDHVQVTVNKQFSEPFTLVEHGDEIAVVPKSH